MSNEVMTAAMKETEDLMGLHPFKAEIKQPQDLIELVELLQHATAPVRAVGSNYSLSNAGVAWEGTLFKTDGLCKILSRPVPDVSESNPPAGTTAEKIRGWNKRYLRNSGHADTLAKQLPYRSVEPGKHLLHVEGGIKIHSLLAALDDLGLALPTMGSGGGQSLVGALATGSHGGDFNVPLLFDAIEAIHLVTPKGTQYWVCSDRPNRQVHPPAYLNVRRLDTPKSLRSDDAVMPWKTPEEWKKALRNDSGKPMLALLRDEEKDREPTAIAGFGFPAAEPSRPASDGQGSPIVYFVRSEAILRSLRVSVGRAGVIYSVVISVVPNYSLLESQMPEKWEDIRKALAKRHDDGTLKALTPEGKNLPDIFEKLPEDASEDKKKAAKEKEQRIREAFAGKPLHHQNIAVNLADPSKSWVTRRWRHDKEVKAFAVGDAPNKPHPVPPPSDRIDYIYPTPSVEGVMVPLEVDSLFYRWTPLEVAGHVLMKEDFLEMLREMVNLMFQHEDVIALINSEKPGFLKGVEESLGALVNLKKGRPGLVQAYLQTRLGLSSQMYFADDVGKAVAETVQKELKKLSGITWKREPTEAEVRALIEYILADLSAYRPTVRPSWYAVLSYVKRLGKDKHLALVLKDWMDWSGRDLCKAIASAIMASEFSKPVRAGWATRMLDVHTYAMDGVVSSNSCEFFFDESHEENPGERTYLDFVDWVVRRAGDCELPVLGFIGIRIMPKASAKIGMQRWSSTVSVEVAEFRSDPHRADKDGNLARTEFFAAVLDHAKEVSQRTVKEGPNGDNTGQAIPHWGQEFTHTGQELNDLYGRDFDLWRKSLCYLGVHKSDSFRTAFSVQKGLEPADFVD